MVIVWYKFYKYKYLIHLICLMVFYFYQKVNHCNMHYAIYVYLYSLLDKVTVAEAYDVTLYP